MTDKRKLPFVFDAQKMQHEVNNFKANEWIPHFNTGYYTGDWSAIPLRSVNGDPTRIFSDPSGLGVYADTIHLKKSTYLNEVINTFKCDKIDIRLLSLKAGSNIKEHRDYGLAIEDGEVRIHIPITTNPELEFYLNKERVIMQEGECWFLNFNYYHSVNNKGTTNRVHLVMDCKVNDWLMAFFK